MSKYYLTEPLHGNKSSHLEFYLGSISYKVSALSSYNAWYTVQMCSNISMKDRRLE